MSPALHFSLLASIASFSFAVSADAAPSPDIAQVLPERAVTPQHTAAKVTSAHPEITSKPTARPANYLTLPARPANGLSASRTARSRAKDFDSRGSFAMQAGQTAEAIAAFEQALTLAPDRTDTWGKLAFLYLKEGNSTKAVDAFRKAKQLGDANGGMITRDASGVLLLP